MVSYKIIKSGDNIEIYEYEHFNLPKKEDNGYDLELIGITPDADRIAERRKQTLLDNGMNLKRMARENFRGNVFFLTLTFEENLQDIDKADRKVKYFFKKMRENYGEISFIGVREKQKRGAIHYHFLVKNRVMENWYIDNVPMPIRKGKKMIKSQQQKDYELMLHNEFWKHGWVDCTMIDFVDDVGAYLGKYLSKGKIEDMEWLEKRRLILRSKDIKKVEPLDEVEDSGLYNAIVEQIEYIKSIAKEDIKNNRSRKRVFSNGYISKYQGKTGYYDVHLNRLSES